MKETTISLYDEAIGHRFVHRSYITYTRVLDRGNGRVKEIFRDDPSANIRRLES